MRDFRLANLKELIEALLRKEYNFILFKEFERSNFNKVIILRHDVDLLPGNSLATAKLESSLGVTGTYYFRTIPETFKPDVIKEIEGLGHEVGYHYETVEKVTKSSYEVKKLRSDGARSASDKVTELQSEEEIKREET